MNTTLKLHGTPRLTWGILKTKKDPAKLNPLVSDEEKFFSYFYVLKSIFKPIVNRIFSFDVVESYL